MMGGAVPLAGLGPRCVRIAARLIAPGDEGLLLQEEAGAFVREPLARRGQAGAARHAARTLFEADGLAPGPILRAVNGAPVFPTGLVGSLAHDDRLAVAATAPSDGISALGVDVEPALPLSQELAALVANERERSVADGPLYFRALFSLKEAVFKALHPLDGRFLEHHDVEVSLAAGLARTRFGAQARIAWAVRKVEGYDALIALACLERSAFKLGPDRP